MDLKFGSGKTDIFLMEDLHNSPFLDQRLLSFVRKILYSRTLPNPISATEIKLSNMAEILKALDKEIDGGLPKALEHYKTYIPVGVASQFLAGCYKRNLLPIGIEILDMMLRDNRSANLRELVTILKESEGSADYLTLLVESHEIEDRHKKPEKTNISGLNLEAMKNFK